MQSTYSAHLEGDKQKEVEFETRPRRNEISGNMEWVNSILNLSSVKSFNLSERRMEADVLDLIDNDESNQYQPESEILSKKLKHHYSQNSGKPKKMSEIQEVSFQEKLGIEDLEAGDLKLMGDLKGRVGFSPGLKGSMSTQPSTMKSDQKCKEGEVTTMADDCSEMEQDEKPLEEIFCKDSLFCQTQEKSKSKGKNEERLDCEEEKSNFEENGFNPFKPNTEKLGLISTFTDLSDYNLQQIQK